MATTARDLLIPFVFEGAAVRGALVRLDTVSRDILGRHPYPPALARSLAELIAASALLASTLKLEGSLLIQLAGEGPVRLLVVECTGGLALRATAQWDSARTQALATSARLIELAGGAEHARLTITLDQQGVGTLYQGIVALEAADVAGLIEHYLTTSEQLQSRLLLAAHDGAAAGLLLQRLPASGAPDDAMWTRLAQRVDAASPDTLLGIGDSAATLTALFPDDDLRVFASRPAQSRCTCSRERVENALRIAGSSEIEAALAERGVVEVTCEFCNRRYAFSAAEARSALAKRETTPRTPTGATQ